MGLFDSIFSDKKKTETTSTQSGQSSFGLTPQIKDYAGNVISQYNPANFSSAYVGPNQYQTGAAETQAGLSPGLMPAFSSALNIGANGLDPSRIAQFQSPYQQQVIDATMADFATQNARQNAGVNANAAKLGALSGTQPLVARQLAVESQNRTQNPIIANLRNQGFNTAAGLAGQSAGLQLSGLGAAGSLAGQQGQLNQGLYQMGSGLQQTQQYGQLLPYQLTSQGAQTIGGLTPYSGQSTSGTATGTSTQTATPSLFSIGTNLAGLGIAAFSDERVKENISPVGETYDGQPIYRYNYKGSPRTEIGLIAQDVERDRPEAVGSYNGIKTVDYDLATRDAAREFDRARASAIDMPFVVDSGTERMNAGGRAGLEPFHTASNEPHERLGKAFTAIKGMLSKANGGAVEPEPMGYAYGGATDGRIDTGRRIYQYFLDRGLPPHQAAAIAGNMAWEGGGRTDLVNPGDNYKHSPRAPHSVGIGQWNDRSQALFDFARKQGIELPQGDLRDAGYVRDAIRRVPLQTQLDFAYNEMQGPEGRAYGAVRNAGNVRDATAGAISYHRPAGWTWGNPEAGHGFSGRLSLAQRIMAGGASTPQPADGMDAATYGATPAPSTAVAGSSGGYGSPSMAGSSGGLNPGSEPGESSGLKKLAEGLMKFGHEGGPGSSNLDSGDGALRTSMASLSSMLQGMHQQPRAAFAAGGDVGLGSWDATVTPSQSFDYGKFGKGLSDMGKGQGQGQDSTGSALADQQAGLSRMLSGMGAPRAGFADGGSPSWENAGPARRVDPLLDLPAAGGDAAPHVSQQFPSVEAGNWDGPAIREPADLPAARDARDVFMDFERPSALRPYAPSIEGTRELKTTHPAASVPYSAVTTGSVEPSAAKMPAGGGAARTSAASSNGGGGWWKPEGIWAGKEATPLQRLGTALMSVSSPTMAGPTNGMAANIMQWDQARREQQRIDNQVAEMLGTINGNPTIAGRTISLAEQAAPAARRLTEAQALKAETDADKDYQSRLKREEREHQKQLALDVERQKIQTGLDALARLRERRQGAAPAPNQSTPNARYTWEPEAPETPSSPPPTHDAVVPKPTPAPARASGQSTRGGPVLGSEKNPYPSKENAGYGDFYRGTDGQIYKRGNFRVRDQVFTGAN